MQVRLVDVHMMPTSDKSASIIAFEREVLRLLCDPGAPTGATAREQAVLSLQRHSWQDAEHRIVFEALAKLPGRDGSELRRQLPAQATRMGFPDVHWEIYFASDGSSRSSDGPEERSSSLDALIARLRAASREPAMNAPALRWFSLADVTLLPAFILWFIWQLQFTARWTWVIFVVWLAASFLLHRDTPKTLGWRADNLLPAAKLTATVIGGLALGLIAIGFALRFLLSSAFTVSPRLPPNLVSWHRLWGYFAFCLLQQVALNSLVHNRMMSLVKNEWVSATLTGVIFAACHWPNPVLVPLTIIGGMALAWLFGRHRNILPLAVGQAILGSIIFWAFPIAWHHHLRVGPGFYGG